MERDIYSFYTYFVNLIIIILLIHKKCVEVWGVHISNNLGVFLFIQILIYLLYQNILTDTILAERLLTVVYLLSPKKKKNRRPEDKFIDYFDLNLHPQLIPSFYFFSF